MDQSEQCVTTYVFPVQDPLGGTDSRVKSSFGEPRTTRPIIMEKSGQTHTVVPVGDATSTKGISAMAKVPVKKTSSLDLVGTSNFPSDHSESSQSTQSRQPIDNVSSSNPNSAGESDVKPTSSVGPSTASQGRYYPPKPKGHSRSASHGGVMGPRSGMPNVDGVGGSSSVAPLPSALKKGHTRAASHGQIVDEPSGNLKGHNRVLSKTEFILPQGHVERPRLTSTNVPSWEGQGRGHSRQASRSESIYTLRAQKTAGKSRLFFWRRDPVEDARTRTIVPNHRVPPGTNEKQHPNGKYPSNHIRTTKYTLISFLPKNLFEQFHRFANLYFISIVLLNWIPAISAFGKEIAMLPVMFVLGVTAIKDLFEDRRRHRSDKQINNSACRVYKRELNRYTKMKWKEMRVGDIVHLSCNEMIPADILVLKTSDPNGLCYIETSNLDGESNLKQREVIRGFVEKQSTFQPSEFHSEIQVGPPTTKIYHFAGNITHPDGTKIPVTKENLLLRDCILKNTDFIEGIVVYAGRETKAMLNNGGPRHKRTGLEKMMNLEVMWCVVILAVLCVIGATGSSLWLSSFHDETVPFSIPPEGTEFSPFDAAFLSFLTFVILLQVMIPLSLYVTIELIKLTQIYHMQSDVNLYDEETNKRIECRAMNIPEDLGQIQYIFSDKTGTLTENKMMFRRCTIGSIDYNHEQPTALEHKLANSRSMSSPPLKINPTLNELLGHSELSIPLPVQPSNGQVTLTSQPQRVHDFFMVLAVCNTVVVAKYPHRDHMNASGVIVDDSTNVQYSRLSPIRESMDSSIASAGFSSQEQNTLLVDYRSDVENSSSVEKEPAVSVVPVVPLPRSSSSGVVRRAPRRLELLPARPLSPISSSNETTPTESPAQRPRFLQLPTVLSRFSKTLNISQNSVVTPTPSPSEFRPIFEAESPDELALVEAAYAYQCKLLKRTPSHVRVAMPSEGLIEYEVLHTFPFDSVRKRMSIVLKHPDTEEIILYCKGADSAIFPKLKSHPNENEDTLRNQTQTNIDNYAREGLRILVMAKRVLSESEYTEWVTSYRRAELDIDNRDVLLCNTYSEIEKDMELIGATGIEDRLQDGVPETIEALRNAGIVVWVLTGDKQETAVNIAYSCRLFSQNMDIIKLNARTREAAERTITFYKAEAERIKTGDDSPGLANDVLVTNNRAASTNENRRLSRSLERPRLLKKERALVVDGKTLTFILDQRAKLLEPFLELSRHCSAVLCCRSTPLQKAYIVSSVKDHLKMRTLAIGDGANDVSMIQRADVGIGISGKEGMQAVMASDFAISKFRYLERLLLVHGHWCYDRLARMILYFFYKNAAFVFVIFWYQLLNGWSGSVMIDTMYLMVFNLFFTALPPMAIGIYDQDASAELLLTYPRLYRQGRLQEVHQSHSFWLNMLDALYQSVVIFFIAYGAYDGSDIGVLEFGTTICASCMYVMLVHMAIEAKSWTIIHILSVLISIIIFYAFAFIYNSLCISCFGFENPYWVIHELVASPLHWLIILVTSVIAVLPRIVIRVMENTLYPSDVTQAILLHRRQANRKDEELFVTWSRSTSSSSVFKERVKCLCWRNLSGPPTSAPKPTVPTISSVST